MLPPNHGLWSVHSKAIMINAASLPGNVFILILDSFQAAVCSSSSGYHPLMGSFELQIKILLSVTKVNIGTVFFFSQTSFSER